MRKGDGALGRFALGTGQMPTDAVVAAAVEAEVAGADAVLVGENPLEPDAFVTAAAVLAATGSVRVGPGVANVWDRHPLTLARGAATLDRLAPGRVLLGVGRGDRDAVEQSLGVSAAGGLAALEDTLRILRPLLDGAAVDHTGRVWSARLEPLPERTRSQGGVRIYLAAVGRRTLELAGRLADGVLLNYAASPEYVSWAVAQLTRGATAAGRDPATVDVLGWVLVARSDVDGAAAQLERVRATVASTLRLPDQGAALAGPAGGLPARLDDATLARFAVIGDGAQVRARLGDYRRAGLRCPVFLPSGMRAVLGRAGAPGAL
jgi:5,10-methylenetetrahydromethanopterin reductase